MDVDGGAVRVEIVVLSGLRLLGTGEGSAKITIAFRTPNEIEFTVA